MFICFGKIEQERNVYARDKRNSAKKHKYKNKKISSDKDTNILNLTYFANTEQLQQRLNTLKLCKWEKIKKTNASTLFQQKEQDFAGKTRKFLLIFN